MIESVAGAWRFRSPSFHARNVRNLSCPAMRTVLLLTIATTTSALVVGGKVSEVRNGVPLAAADGYVCSDAAALGSTPRHWAEALARPLHVFRGD